MGCWIEDAEDHVGIFAFRAASGNTTRGQECPRYRKKPGAGRRAFGWKPEKLATAAVKQVVKTITITDLYRVRAVQISLKYCRCVATVDVVQA